MRKTGVAAYAATAGNRGVWMLRRDLDKRTEFVMFTLWDSLEAIKRFAGNDYETAVLYPEDERYLIERDLRASHFDVDAYEPGFDDRPAQLRGEQVVLRPLASAYVERIAAIRAEPEVRAGGDRRTRPSSAGKRRDAQTTRRSLLRQRAKSWA